MKIAVIGTGYWGSKIKDTLLKMDINVVNYDIADDLTSIVDQNVLGAIIATPAETHKKLLKTLVSFGINCLVEKPITLTYQEFLEIEDQLLKNKVMVGHILLYNDGYTCFKNLLKNKKILHLEHRRYNWGRMQKDINLISHLSPHDLSILDDLLAETPMNVESKGIKINKMTQEDLIICNLNYKNLQAQIQLGWNHYKKIRTICAITTDGHYVWDDVKDQISYFCLYLENGKQIKNEYKNFVLINLKKKSPLENQIDAFIKYCKDDIKPITDIAHAKRVMYIMDCLEKSLYSKKNYEL
jgi:UDP-2-acetamido-3-amino-2,3-dideoxy-glucuronate N-acetyltransferase